MRAYERLLNYVKIHTTSDESCEKVPSSDRQFVLGKQLAEELRSLSVIAECDEHCYVWGYLDAVDNLETAPCVGFIAHLDTAPDFSGEGVNPIVHPNYDGGEVKLGDSGRVLSPKDFPHLSDLKGRTLITTDGTTLLGADDKAGIAEIMTLLEEIQTKKISHGRIAICFTPDEEIGNGTACFNRFRFGGDFAYTLDGGQEGEVVWENFNAASAVVKINGFNVHPGSAKNLMKNAALIACEFANMLPPNETPATTEGREGFYHLTDMEGDVESATLHYILRDHDSDKLEEKKRLITEKVSEINQKYGDVAELTITDSYRNMKEKIDQNFGVVQIALDAVKACGLTPTNDPIRGGTDGARLTWEGLPTPNLGTGGYAFHGPYEHITVEGMDKAVDILKEIIRNVNKMVL